MSLISRAKGLILAPRKEWDAITTEDVAIPDLYRNYILYLAAIPPFASFISSWLFGFYSRATLTYVHSTFGAGLWRALVQYALSLPAIFLIAFVLSMAAPYFEGETNDRRALTLAAYAQQAYLEYALSVVKGRALPEVDALRVTVQDEVRPVLALLTDPRPEVRCAALGALALGLSGSGQLYAFLLFFVVSGLGLFALTRRSRAIDADAYSDPALGRVDLPDRRG